MVQAHVVSRITYGNQLLIPTSLYPALRVPHGVTPYEPIAISIGEMSRKCPTKLPAPAGLTTLELELEAPGVTLVAPARPGPKQFRLTSGEIILKVVISIFIVDRYRKVPSLFEVIMEHEYLHVQDWLALANVTMPSKIRDDATLRTYFQGATWTGSSFFDRIHALSDRESQAVGNRRDSGPEYEKYKKKVTALLPKN